MNFIFIDLMKAFFDYEKSSRSIPNSLKTVGTRKIQILDSCSP